MAIYHLHVKNISRGKGQSAIASASYRRAARLFNEREEKFYDYTHKKGVIHSEITATETSPHWVKELIELHQQNKNAAAEKLWNLVEASEKRVDARLAKEVEFALPMELTQEENIQLVREYIHDQFALRGMIADWNVHWDEGNPHVHVMLTTRHLTEQGFGQKVREWNSDDLVKDWREKWAEYANFHLRLHQHSVRIDHRSYQAQGINLIPSVHVGKAVTDMGRRGIATQLMKEANETRRENLTRIAANPDILLKKLSIEHETFSTTQLGQELGRYINDKGGFSYSQQAILAKAVLEKLISEERGEETKRKTYEKEKVLEKNKKKKVELTDILTPHTVSEIFRTIESHESVFSERELARAVAVYTDHAEIFTKAIFEIKKSPELIFLGFGEDGRERFTTQRMFKLENDIQKMADHLRKLTHLQISSRYIDKQLDFYQKNKKCKLTEEQMIAVKHMLEKDAISCVVGRAGTGKSFSLGAANAVWKSKGLRVFGISLLGVAASNLDKDSGIYSRTIDSFRLSLANGSIQLGYGDVVVMDEAGVTDSVSMHRVLKAVHKAKAKLVLIGDHAQLQPVGPGACFRALVERIGFKEIHTVYRQKGWQAEATVAFSQGDIVTGLEAYRTHGCIHIERTAQDALARLVDDWEEMRSHQNTSVADLKRYLVLAYRNQDVQELNALIRAKRVDKREIAEGYSVSSAYGKTNLSYNDRIIFLENNSTLGVRNGNFGTVQGINFTERGEVISFTVLLDNTDKEILVRPSLYREFAHGYAVTTHKSQSVTFDHTFIYAGGIRGWDRYLTYVAMSRHRKTCHLYSDEKTHHDFLDLSKTLSRGMLKDSVLDFPLAFSARRGIDNQKIKFLPDHLIKKLASLKEKLLGFYKEITSIESFSEKNQKLEEIRFGKEEAIHKKREQARIIADYVDASRGARVLWKLTHTKPKNSSEYRLMVEAIEKRDAIANEIMQSILSYERSISSYGLSVEKIQKQAQAHTRKAYEKTSRDLLDQYIVVRDEFEKIGKERTKQLGESKDLSHDYRDKLKEYRLKMMNLASDLVKRTDLMKVLKDHPNQYKLLNEIQRLSAQHLREKTLGQGHDQSQDY